MNADTLCLQLVRTHPRDAARTLEQLDMGEVARFLGRIPPAEAARLVRLLVPQAGARCLAMMTVQEAGAVLDHLQTDIAAVLLRRMNRDHRRELLGAVGARKSAALRIALRYSDAVVGSVLDPDVFAVTANMRVAAVVELLQEQPDRQDDFLFVIDDRQHLVGVVEIKNLLRAEADTRIQELSVPPLHVFSARESMAAVRNHRVWSRLNLVPVVDYTGLLLGGIWREAVGLAQPDGERAGEPEDMIGTLFSFAGALWGGFAELFVGDGPADRRRESRR
jgi:magnesium transporter